jgi:hypothetical protein
MIKIEPIYPKPTRLLYSDVLDEIMSDLNIRYPHYRYLYNIGDLHFGLSSDIEHLISISLDGYVSLDRFL